jgi:hypothetical protein
MIHNGFYEFVRRPEFIAREIGLTMKSPYRVQTLLSNLPRVGEIRRNARDVA